MSKKQALGKGIASLIKSNTTQAFLNDLKVEDKSKKSEKHDQSGLYMVETSLIRENPNQPRKIFKEGHINELSKSIKENGIIQPLIVTRLKKGFELIAGERRLRAARLAKLDKVPVVIRNATSKEKLVVALIENVQRSDLNCVEEALAYFQLMDDFNLNQEEVAKKIGKERSTIANFLRILKLPREVIDFLQKEKLSFGHAKVLASIKEAEKIKRMALLAVDQNLSVRELEKELKKSLKVKSSNGNPFFDEKLDRLRQTLEKKTGFHFNIEGKKAGVGNIVIKYSNEAEFNDIYDFLIRG